MSHTARMLLSVLVNALLFIIALGSLYLLENNWQAKIDREKRELIQGLYFNKAELYLKRVESELSAIASRYSGDCSREFVLDMRGKVFKIPGAIEFGIVEAAGEKGVVTCNSWGEEVRTKVTKPTPTDGLVITGPHNISSLGIPVYVIRKTVDSVEFNIFLKQRSVDDFIANNPEIFISVNNKRMGEKYRESNVVNQLSYVTPPVDETKILYGYFIPGSLLTIIIFYFLISPKIVKLIERYVLRLKIKNHHYRNEYQPIIDTKNKKVFSIEVLLRSNNGVNVKDSIDKIKHLNLSVDHTIFQINQLKLSFSELFIAQNSFQINVSSLHLEDKIFIEKMLNVDASIRRRLILEVVEDENLMAHKKVIQKRMKLLKDKGYRFAIDDFGTMYSSLSYISEFDFDIVKADKIFIGDNVKNNAILKSIITLTNEIGIQCMAEGIETEEERAKIEAIGIHLHQGWYYGRSMSADDIVNFTVEL